MHPGLIVILCHDITLTQSNLNTIHVVSTVLAVRVDGHAVVGGIEQFLVRHVHRAVLGQVEGVGAGGSAGQAVALAHGLHKDAAGQPAPARDEAQELASLLIGGRGLQSLRDDALSQRAEGEELLDNSQAVPHVAGVLPLREQEQEVLLQQGSQPLQDHTPAGQQLHAV